MKKYLLFLLLPSISSKSFSQKLPFNTKCELNSYFVKSSGVIESVADTTINKDAIFTIIDIDNIFQTCNIETSDKIKIINSGEKVELIKKESIFSLQNFDKRTFIFTSNKVKGGFYLHVYCPYTGAVHSLKYVIKHEKYLVEKISGGNF